jgi:hypothetical protein
MGNNNYNPTPISVPDKRVKSLDEFIKYVFDILKTELYLQEQYDIYRIKINGNVLFIRLNKFIKTLSILKTTN